MNSVKKFNALNGAIVPRETITVIVDEADADGQFHIVQRLTKLLRDHPGATKFKLEVTTTSQIEKQPNSIDVTQLECEQITPDTLASLGLPKYQEDIYKKLSDEMLDYIKSNDNLLKWDNEMISGLFDSGTAYNYKTKKHYKGYNYFRFNILYPLILKKAFKNPAFLTKAQVESYANGKIKEGSRSFGVIYFSMYYKYKDDNIEKIAYSEKEFIAWIKKNNILKKLGLQQNHLASLVHNSRRFVIKESKVYNADDIEGINFKFTKKNSAKAIITEQDKIEVADAIIACMPKAPEIIYKGKQPAYYPGLDTVEMPKRTTFKSIDAFYAVLFHELTHSTKHAKRLNDQSRGGEKFGDKEYAREELVAELGALFLCAESGILHHRVNNTKAYLKSWSRTVADEIAKNPEFFYRSASKAQKAVEYILDRDKNDIPAYYKKLGIKLVEVEPKKAKYKVGDKVMMFNDEPELTITKVIEWPDKNATYNLENKKAKISRNNIPENKIKKATKPKLLLEKKIDPKKLTAAQIKQIGKEYASDILWKDDIVNYVNRVLAEKHKRSKTEKQSKKKDSQLALFGKIPEKPTVEMALKYAEKNLYNKSVYHRDIGKKIVFTKSGIKKAINGKGKVTRTRLQLVFIAKDLLQKARLFSSESDAKKRKHIVLIYKLRTTTVLDGNKFEVLITLQQRKNGVLYYDHTAVKLKRQVSKPVDKSEQLSRAKLPLKNKTTKKTNNNKKLGTVVIDVSTNAPTPAGVNEGYASAEPLALPVPIVEPTKTVEEKPEFENTPTSKPKNKLMAMKFDTIEMDEGWQDFMQHPAANMKIAIYGKPKNGKTSGSLQLAKYLTKKGNVLYNFADQGFNKSTQDLWLNSGLANTPNAEPSDIETLEDLEAEIKRGNYKYVFIDMINDYINRENITPQEFKDRFIKKFPNVGFILVFEVTKSGDFKGDQGWTHIVDAIVTVENFLMENRGRYGVGHYVVWEEGLKRFDPKKYDEICDVPEIPNEISI